MSYATEQEAFWAGGFGDEYTRRNDDRAVIAANTALFSRILARTSGISSVMEFGANRGMNLCALRPLLPEAQFSAVEINAHAVELLRQTTGATVYHESLLSFEPPTIYDLVIVKGVLIHLNPDSLDQAYEVLHVSSGRYLVVAEYYNPTPVAVAYRGHSERLFKRDFAGDLLERFADLSLLDYGFVYHRDPVFPLDDITWFLLQKTSSRST